jgi:glucose/mannose transport system substrate-binding protein
MKASVVAGSAVSVAMTLSVCLDARAAPRVEVLHWWTSQGEAAALATLRGAAQAEGLEWKEASIVGGGGEQAMRTLKARVDAGISPTAVQVMGLEVHEWAKRGVLTDLNELAAKEGWDKVVPPALQKFSKFNNKWVAVPVNVHSYNWVWASNAVLAKAGVAGEPKTWDQFVAAAEAAKRAGFVGLAHGGQPWQTAMVFDGVVLATGGADFYRKAFIERHPHTLSSPTMKKVFARMTQLRGLVDKDSEGRDWNFATAMVIGERAAFQIMGDFAKGEFLAAGKRPGKDFLCFRLPGSQGAVSFGLDNFAMFAVQGADAIGAQQRLAKVMLDKKFQSDFNVIKGSVPARMDVSDAAFDACGKRGIKELAEASRKNALVGTVVFGHAVAGPIKNSITEIVDQHFNGRMSDDDAVKAIAAALRRTNP